MAKANVIDSRLRIASASLRGYRRRPESNRNDIEIKFWQREVDRLLDAKLAAKESPECLNA